MFTLEVTLRGNPNPVIIQRKEEEAADQLYQQILTTLQQGEPQFLELTCDRTGKRAIVLTPEICAAQLTPKAGATAVAGPRTGFMAQIDANA